MANFSASGSSKQYVGIVDMLCEGPIYGLVNGKSSVYLNDISFESATEVGATTDTDTSGRPLTLGNADSSKVMSLSTGSVNPEMVGKMAIIEVGIIGVSSITTTYESTTRIQYNYINLDEDATSDWNTFDNPKTFVRLRNTRNGASTDTNTFTVAGNAGALQAYELPIRRNYASGVWEVVLIQGSTIVSVDSANNTFTVEDDIINHDSLGTEGSSGGNALFRVRDAITFTVDIPNINTNVTKVEGSSLQFRKGDLNQAPIQQVHGVSGAVTRTGNGPNIELKQVSDFSTQAAGTYVAGTIDGNGYPTGQSLTQNGGVAQEFSSSAFGASSPSQVDELTLRINYNSLCCFNQENGDKENAYALYKFEIALKLNDNWGPWLQIFSKYGGIVSHRGNTTAPVSFDHIIGLNRFKPFQDFKIRVHRLTRHVGLPVRANGGTGGETDRKKWNLQASGGTGGGNLSSTIKDKFVYPKTALAGITFSSKSFTNLPKRSYDIQGLCVKIPDSYTPREYSDDGVAKYENYWSGNFKERLFYTDNPAWVFYDIVTNNRYGAGRWIEQSDIDKFALYRIAKYCDELVPSGVKDANGADILEPRFRANIYLAKSTDVYKVLKDMATIFTGMLYWLDGKLSPIPDVPAEPVYTFSKANVIDGNFAYETAGKKTLANQIVVTWNDPTRNYEPVPLIIEDRESIVKERRIISQNSIAFGATSEGQAMRYGRWKLWTSQNQKEVVQFKTGLQGAYIRPGDIINVQDKDRYGIDFSGKIKEVNTETPGSEYIVLDRLVTTPSNAGTYKLTTVVKEYAAYYTGLDTKYFNSSGKEVASGTAGATEYNKGDKITTNFYVWDSTSDPAVWSSETLNTEGKATNAFYEAQNTTDKLPLGVEWKPYTHVITKTVTLTSGTEYTTVSMASGESWYTDATSIPAVGSIYALSAVESGTGTEILGSKKEYKVLGIVFEEEKNIYGIAAVEHYNVKYDAVDKDYALGALPDSTYADIEDINAVVPAPSNIYVVLETDSTKPGEEIRVEWIKAEESYLDADGNTNTRDYQFLSGYELHHNVPDIESPIFTTQTSHRFAALEDGEYIFRVRTVSNKQNVSSYTSTKHNSIDPFSVTIPRIVGGLPKGLYTNSTLFSTYGGSTTTDYEIVWEKNNAIGYSIGASLLSNSSISTALNSIPIYGLVNRGFPVANYDTQAEQIAGRGLDFSYRDDEWYYILYDGSCSLGYWNTDTLDGLPFMQKIPNLGAQLHPINGGQNIQFTGWRGASQTWAEVTAAGGGTVTASLPAYSNKLTGSGASLDLSLRDIVHFEGRNSQYEFAAYKIDDVEFDATEGTTKVTIRGVGKVTGGGGQEGFDIQLGNNTDTGNWRTGDIVKIDDVLRTTTSSPDNVLLNGNEYYVRVNSSSTNDLANNEFFLYGSLEAANGDSLAEDSDSLIINEEYKITTLGTTNWNTVAGTTGVTYTAGDTITVEQTASGTGTATKTSHFIPASQLGGTYLEYTGYVKRVKVQAAKVIAIVDDNTVLLDRSFNTAINNRTIYKYNYKPSYSLDAVIGRIRSAGYSTSSSEHTFIVDKFLTIDPGLSTAGLQAIVTPSIPVIQYNSDGSTQSTNVDGAITVRVDAIGFSNPQFRIVEITGGGANIDVNDYTVAWQDSTNVGGTFYSTEIIADGTNSGQSDNIPFEEGEPIIITAQVREEKASGLNVESTGQITKITSGSDGLDGKTVHLESDDYSIIYDESGLNPLMNGSNRTITLTASAFNFTAPQFKFIFTGTNLSTSSSFTLGTNEFSVFRDPATDATELTATIQVPTSWNNNWNTTKQQTAFNVKVEVREQGDGSTTVEAFDEISIIGVHSSEDGYWAILSNTAHTIPTTSSGQIIAEHNSLTNETGYATIENSGTTLEVGKGGTVLEPYQGTAAEWASENYEDQRGKYFVTYTENGSSNSTVFNKGAISYSDQDSDGTDDLITIGDHEFTTSGWNTETAQLGFEINLEGSSYNTIFLTQGFSKSKQGFGGISVVNTNGFESLPSSSYGKIQDYSLTENSINIFMSGQNLPYYPASWIADTSNTLPDTVTAYWQFISLIDENIDAATVDDDDNTNTSYMTPGTTGAMSIAAASNMAASASSASITWTFRVWVLVGETWISEDVTATQVLTRTKGVENISSFLNVNHFVFDGDSTTSSPSSSTVTLTAVSTINETENPYITYQIENGTESTSWNSTSTADGRITKTFNYTRPDYETSGSINYPITFTSRFYDWDGTTDSTLSAALAAGSAVLLDTDTVTLSASKTPADNVVMELTNDSDIITVGATSSTSAIGSLTLSTTAKIFFSGTEETDYTQWNWNATTSGLTGSFDSSTVNQYNITGMNANTNFATVTITASRIGYGTHDKVYTLARVVDGEVGEHAVIYYLVGPTALVYNPNTDTFTGGTGTNNKEIEFDFKKLDTDPNAANPVTSASLYYKIDGIAGNSGDADTSATWDPFAAVPTTSDSTTIQVFTDSSFNNEVDRETIPLIIGGEDGVSLTSTQEYYLKTSTNSAPGRYSSGTTIDTGDGVTGWTTSVIQPDSTNKYLWNFNRNTKSDSSTEDTNVILLSQTVKSISSITEEYQVHNSPTAANTSGTWYSTIAGAVAAQAITSSYPYLWNRTTIAYTDGSTSTVVYSLIAVRGNDGVSFSGTTEYYILHNNKTNAPARYSNGTTIASGWSTTVPTPTTTNRYVWNFSRNSKSDGTFNDSAAYLISELLKSISSITEEYQKGSSATTAPTGTWYSTIAGAGSIDANNPYMWNRTTIAYTDGSANTVTTTVIAARGSDGVSYTGTAEYYKLTNSNSAPGRYSNGTTIDTGWSTSPSTPTSTNQYLWNFNRNSKSDGTFQDSAVYLVTQFVQDGKGISSITEQYALHTSPSSAPSSGWNSTFPTISANYPYIWNRTLINYTDGTNSGYIYTLIAARGSNGTTPVKGVDYDDGDPGADAGQVVTGYIYSANNNPTVPNNQTYNFANAGLDSAFSSITGWSVNPPTFSSTNNVIYYASYKAVETVNSSGNATGSGTVTFSARQVGTSFTGLVTFASGDFSTGGSTITAIDGGNIATNSITATQLQISNSTGASSAGINMNYNSGNPKIEISDGSSIRVVLGYLS